MQKAALLKKLEIIFDDAERCRMFGTLEIEIRDGKPTVFRTTKTDRLDGENPHAKQSRY
jgi:hypothetical protein